MFPPNSQPQGQYPDSWPLTPDQKAFVHASERLHFRRSDDLATNPIIPDDLVRSKTAKLFDELEGVETSDEIELVNGVAAQYESSVATWTKLNIPTDGIQTKAEVTAWLNSLPAKTLENLAAYGEVRLKFIPPVKALELLSVIENGYCDWGAGWESVGVKEWEFGLTTNEEEMPFDPRIYYINGVDDKDGTRKNGEMIGLYEEKFQEEGLDIMPQKAAVPSAVDALAQGKELDRRISYTAFKRPEGADFLPYMDSYFNGLGLRADRPDDSGYGLRARPWVKGEKI